MTQLSAEITVDQLRSTFVELGERRRLFLWLARLVRAVWLWAAALLMIVIADAIWPISLSGRLAFDILLLASIPCGLWFSRTREVDVHRGPLSDARKLEVHHDLTGNPLVNGLFLAPASRRAKDTLVRTLAGRAHKQARETVEQVDRDVVLNRRRLHRQGGYAGGVMLTWLVALILAPALVTTGLGRLLWPMEDSPAFSWTQIQLQADSTQPMAGDDVKLQATITGEPASHVELVELDEEDVEIRRWPMSAQTLSMFVRTLRSVRQPMTIQAEANGTRSKRLHIEPRQPDPPEPEVAREQPKPSDEAKDFDGQLQSQWPAIHQGLMDLRQQADQIGEMLEQLDALEPGSQAWQDQLAKIEKAMRQFRQDAADLAKKVRQAMKDASPEDRKKLQQLAEMLDNLSLCRLGNCPNPGVGQGMGTGVGGGFGSGAGGGMMGPTGSWLAGLRMAQANDLALFNDMMQAMGLSPSPFGSAGPKKVKATSLPGPPPPIISGTYDETMTHSNDGPIPLEAAMQGVPASYRALVDRYFERLAEDERNRP